MKSLVCQFIFWWIFSNLSGFLTKFTPWNTKNFIITTKNKFSKLFTFSGLLTIRNLEAFATHMTSNHSHSTFFTLKDLVPSLTPIYQQYQQYMNRYKLVICGRYFACSALSRPLHVRSSQLKLMIYSVLSSFIRQYKLWYFTKKSRLKRLSLSKFRTN